ncbi:MAG: TcpQ domain-containing protein, partial [Alphaproteobacteria bacterium]
IMRAPEPVPVVRAKPVVKIVEKVEPRYSDEQLRAMALKQLSYAMPPPVRVAAPMPVVEPVPAPVEVREVVRKAPRVIAHVEREPEVVAVVPQGIEDVVVKVPEPARKVVVEEGVSVAPVGDAGMPPEDLIAYAAPRDEVVVKRHEVAPQIVKVDALAPRWSARKGNTLRSVLQLWAEREGVEFVWDADVNYKIGANYDSADAFAPAVAGLLDVYMREAIRPVGHLQIDPESGRKRLTIFASSDE